jgi:hypothetical protein
MRGALDDREQNLAATAGVSAPSTDRNLVHAKALGSMADDKPKPDRTGNEPAPLLLIGVGVAPLLAILGWFLGWFG